MNIVHPYSLLAVSGGADSMYLLHRCIGIEGIHVAHVNYNIREDSGEDMKLVQKVCSDYNIPCHVLEVTNPPQTGVEEWARDIRYNFFKSLIQTHKLCCVVTAHNANDQAETVLMRIFRGTGLKGLCGIHSYNESLMAYRPLLNYTKDYIYSECKRLNIDYREDSTNAESKYLRNWFRNEYIEPSMVDSLVQISQKSIELYEAIINHASNIYKNSVYYHDDKYYISKDLEPTSLLFYYLANQIGSHFEFTEAVFQRMFSDDPTTNRFYINKMIVCNKRKKKWIIIEGIKNATL